MITWSKFSNKYSHIAKFLTWSFQYKEWLNLVECPAKFFSSPPKNKETHCPDM